MAIQRTALVALVLISSTVVMAREAPPQTYVQLIVKACPALEITGQENRPAAVTGYYADPINQGLVYDDVRSPSKEEREAYFETQHCVDVPVPPEVATGGQDPTDITLAQCIGHRGYMTAMQFLESHPAYRKTTPAVGAWQCVEQPFPIAGVATM